MNRKISLCMIVKNEEEVLGRCLESVRGLADEMSRLHPQVMESIDHTGELSQEDEQAIRECWETYKKQVSATWQA